MANLPELTKAERQRYSAVYCGICRRIRTQAGQVARLGLSYDMAFLALLLGSLYEPEETAGTKACKLHPIRPRAWTDHPFIRYAADMNVLLACFKARDDWRDEGRSLSGRFARHLEQYLPDLKERYPRQTAAVEACLDELDALEQANCPNPDLPANRFGALMAELMVYREDHWEKPLRQLGMSLGRYIYLADAAVDYRRDKRKGQYNPFLAMGAGEDRQRWEEYLVLAMGRCTAAYEHLPLVRDKKLLDNILYSGVWVEYKRRKGGPKATREEENGAGSV